ncbi:MAG: hypothetical protein LKE40_07920 [Spirochaetia bacterium]|jgi:hypothetical protein|nr:hypothetical protein [Spirochaetia bacterium]
MFIVLGAISLMKGYTKDSSDISLALLNQLTLTANQVLEEQDNRLMLDDIYSSLLNNYDPSIIDETTQFYIHELLDDIENFRITDIERQRLQILYEHEETQAIKQAIPSPISIMGMSYMIRDPLRAIVAVVGTASSSVSSYAAAKDSIDLEFMQKNWKLDDQERATIHNLNESIFDYIIYQTNAGNLNKTDSLSQESLSEFVKNTNDKIIVRRLQWLLDNQAVYAKLPDYWLALSKTYYENGKYQGCLDALKSYKNLVNNDHIYRKDIKFGQALTRGVVAFGYVCNDPVKYHATILQMLQTILDNTSNDDWLQRYFCAVTYLSIASDDFSDKNACIDKAYVLVRSNIIELSKQQENSLQTYVMPVKKIPEKKLKAMTKERRDAVEKDYKQLIKSREHELPPLSPAYLQNIQFLLQIQREEKSSQDEIYKINQIIKQSLIVPQLLHSLFNVLPSKSGINLKTNPLRNSLVLTLPATFIASDSKIEIKGLDEKDNLYRVVPKKIMIEREKNDTDLQNFRAKIIIPVDGLRKKTIKNILQNVNRLGRNTITTIFGDNKNYKAENYGYGYTVRITTGNEFLTFSFIKERNGKFLLSNIL